MIEIGKGGKREITKTKYIRLMILKNKFIH